MKKRKKPQKRYRRDVENGGDSSGRRDKRRRDSVGSVKVDQGYRENSKEAERQAPDAQVI